MTYDGGELEWLAEHRVPIRIIAAKMKMPVKLVYMILQDLGYTFKVCKGGRARDVYPSP